MTWHERAQRVEWRRRESNPRPVITRMAASTCVVGGLISTVVTNTDTLHHGPVVFISPGDQRPNHQASPQIFKPDTSQTPASGRDCELGSQTNRSAETDATGNCIVIGS